MLHYYCCCCCCYFKHFVIAFLSSTDSDRHDECNVDDTVTTRASNNIWRARREANDPPTKLSSAPFLSSSCLLDAHSSFLFDKDAEELLFDERVITTQSRCGTWLLDGPRLNPVYWVESRSSLTSVDNWRDMMGGWWVGPVNTSIVYFFYCDDYMIACEIFSLLSAEQHCDQTDWLLTAKFIGIWKQYCCFVRIEQNASHCYNE